MRREEIERELIARTGFVTEARRCPIHGAALELVFDETDRSKWSNGFPVVAGAHDVNRVRWRCEVCVGSYTENYFCRSLTTFRPPAAKRLLLRCPSCGSRRVTHGCVPECCEQHACPDCKKGFEARVELVHRGEQKYSDDELPEHGFRDYQTRIPGRPALRSGFTREFRRCPNPEHRAPLELVLLLMSEGYVPEAPMLVGWYCAACDASHSESCFHHHERGFISDATPAVCCPQCGSTNVELTDPEDQSADGAARCKRCGAQLRIHLES